MPPNYVDESIIDAIGLWESDGGHYNALGDLGLKHPAFGAWQFRQPAYADVQQFEPELRKGQEGPHTPFDEMGLEQAMTDPTLQRLAARRYLDVLQHHYGVKGLDMLISGYNWGPGVRKMTTPPNPEYVRNVKSKIGKKMPAPPKKVTFDQTKLRAKR